MEEDWRLSPDEIILADSGYALKQWLITLDRLNEEKVQRFNKSHKKTRTLIEQAIGILNEKFP
nr:unnamed protein product [Callosobruchus analis]